VGLGDDCDARPLRDHAARAGWSRVPSVMLATSARGPMRLRW
jgi:hypothetical protein